MASSGSFNGVEPRRSSYPSRSILVGLVRGIFVVSEAAAFGGSQNSVTSSKSLNPRKPSFGAVHTHFGFRICIANVTL
jgi:hypothetical protein